MVEVGLAFVGALVAWIATAALSARAYRSPGFAAGIWVGSAAAVTVALSAAFPAALLDFSNVTFRIFHIGVGLLGPLLLAWGAVEYAVDSPRARFGVRLVVTTLTVVPLVVLVMDRLRGRYDTGYPALGDHYDVVPTGALTLVHVFVGAALLAAAITVARRMGDDPEGARRELSVLGLVALAALLEVVVSRLGLGSLGQLMLIGAVAALWGAVVWAAAPPRGRGGGRRRGRRRGGDHDDDADPDHDDYDDYDEDDDPVEKEEPVRRRRRAADYDDEPVTRSRSRSPKLHGIITIYTLADGHAAAFDECAEEVVDEVGRNEPDTLLFACHTVPRAPLQRIVYAIYRDQLAFEEHEQQPYVVDFARRRAVHVVATNVIELALSGASATDNLADMLMPRQ
ncbi:putative quinol monooxygenase [Actinorugispora endophytica]|uniref:Quinol monooxygenase YgiN n=1 Tax=Actinorugispora endophytica TaxID=1605990 RepID=A0A4R6V725_9ACTN|nr:antibiotic biosynthesis monooxygenase [Actinorugispora endophytica]TDQ54906.1 quinol monooxygenase YgiN [Actinorugispora endophytica]